MTQTDCYPHLHPLFANGFDVRVIPMIRHHFNLIPPEHVEVMRHAAMPHLRKVQKRLERKDSIERSRAINAQVKRGLAAMAERHFAFLLSELQARGGSGSASRLISAAVASAQRFAENGPALRRAQAAVDQIIQQVAQEHRVCVADILSIRRARPAILARQDAFYRVRLKLGLSYPAIGALFGRDHSSVMNGVTAHAQRAGLPHPDEVTGTPAARKKSGAAHKARSCT